ncbi:MAG TPA: regulatory protein RecX [Gemmatimonadaceae bacterium]|nr:regulatory protein RecX [Gemmatimonadaceae bacterium]
MNPVISAILAHSRKPGRFVIMVDAVSAGLLDAEGIERLGLRVGMPLGSSLQAAVERESQFTATFDRAANMLAHRSRSVAELRRQLMAKREPPHAIERAIERLTALGALDDGRFARQFVRTRAVDRAQSRRRIHAELARRGVDRRVADAAVADVFADEAIDEAAALDRLALKKLRMLDRCDQATRRRRLFGFLARRGYEPGAIRDVLARLVV